MEDKINSPVGNKNSLRKLAKAIGVDHSTLSKIASGKYGADPSNVVRKILDNITGVTIPVHRYDDILNMLKAARFSKFGETSLTAAWLYNLINESKEEII